MKNRKSLNSDNPLEILDKILVSILKTTENEPFNDLNTLWNAGLLFDINSRDQKIIFDKLKRDGFIENLNVRIDPSNLNSLI